MFKITLNMDCIAIYILKNEIDVHSNTLQTP